LPLIAARFNHFIVEHLVNGASGRSETARRRRRRHRSRVVPGSFEIPRSPKAWPPAGKYAAVICLGAIIRGDTIIHRLCRRRGGKGCRPCGSGDGVPVIFGILTATRWKQAIIGLEPKAGNKGFEAAMTAIEMVNLLQRLPNDQFYYGIRFSEARWA